MESWNQSPLRGEGRGDDEVDGMDTRCADDDDDDCCAAVPLAGPIDLPYPVLPYLLYLLGYVCTVYTVHEVSFSGFDVVADSQLSGIDPQAGPISSFFLPFIRKVDH